MSNQISKVMKKLFFILLFSLITIDVSAQEPGVYIMSLSGTFVHPKEWSPEQFGDANAVALVTSKMRVLIALTDASKYDIECGPAAVDSQIVQSLLN